MNGDQEAFGQLFRRFYSLLYQYGSKICTNPSALEDSIQELFIELWQRQPSEPLHSVKAYLLQSLKFKLYKLSRSKQFSLNIDQAENTPFELSYEAFIIDKEENSERIRNIVAAINNLPARQKEVIYLKIYKELSYEEVSSIMQINYQATRNLLYQALKTLKRVLVPFLTTAFLFLE